MRNFEPWIGARYWSPGLNGIRVLILGESSYGPAESAYRESTVDDVLNLAQSARNPFFTKVYKLVSGLESQNADRTEFWERVAFYNFIQSLVGNGPRERPTDAMWLAAREPFLETLSDLRPQVIIALGYTLHRFLPAIPEPIILCVVQHPSAYGFTYGPSRSSITAALDQASLPKTA